MAHEIDELLARLQAASSRRATVTSAIAGAVLSLGGAAAVGANGKQRKRKRRVAGESNALSNGKRVACSCTGTTTVTCETVKVKPKKLRKILKHPDSHRGACEDLSGTATSTTTTSTTSTTSTTTTTTTTTTTPIP